MTFINKIKQVFGFAETDIEQELSDDFPSAVVTPLKRNNDYERADLTQSVEKITPEPVLSVEPEIMPDEMFDSVVKFFNESLPPYLRDNLDTEKQRRQLYDTLSDASKSYIARLHERATRETEQRWADNQSTLRKEMEAIQTRAQQIEEQSVELKNLKLSAERQKRALSERVHELEAKIAAFDAEREQYELENKSLINKLRSSSVQEDDMKALRDDNMQLREQIRLLKSAVNTDSTGTDAATAQDLDKLQAENQILSDDKKQLLDDIALLKKKCEIADTMINDLNHRVTVTRQSLSDREAEVASLKAEFNLVKESSAETNPDETQRLKDLVDDLSSKLNDAETAHKQSVAELNEARETITLFEQTLTRFEEIKAEKNSVIADLRSQNDNLKNELDHYKSMPVFDENERESLLNEIQSLKDTIKHNLEVQAQSEMALRHELDQMRHDSANQRPKKVKRAKESITLDESLDNTDWLVSSPTEEENIRLTGVSDNEFGYQEPKRKNPPEDNAAQMLLW